MILRARSGALEIAENIRNDRLNCDKKIENGVDRLF
jgi:hypothetical protein